MPPHTTEPLHPVHMESTPKQGSEHALTIWLAGLEAVKPGPMLARAWLSLSDDFKKKLANAPQVIVVGGGKAGAAMAEALEANLGQAIERTVGVVNVPAGTDRALKKVRLNAARPAGSNHPTAEGVAGSEEMLKLLRGAGPNDVAFCLLSGGGSALLPAPVDGVTLADKQAITKLLHGCGATIGEMNAVRKHLSRMKGGQLAQAFRGAALVSFIVSDVIGDPLDVIASGPTAPDPTTFAQCLEILNRYELRERTPKSVLLQLEAGAQGDRPETLKAELPHTTNIMIGSNALALAAAQDKALSLSYDVVNLGPNLEGDTTAVARDMAKLVVNTRKYKLPGARPTCVLLGGETTVNLGENPGKGGRNQEFVLAMMVALGEEEMRNTCVLSGGTDGEDGPTDAAGAWATTAILETAKTKGLNPEEYLERHDAYRFFEATGGLIKTGLTETNVMDVRVILVE